MNCPKCGIKVSSETCRVLDNRPSKKLGTAVIRRRRQCRTCQCRWTTLEAIVPTGNLKMAKDNFDPEFVIGIA